MSWLRENKFLAGLLGVTVLGVAVLVFEIFTEWSKYGEAVEKYQAQGNELTGLLAGVPSTERRNEYKQQQQKLSDNLADLRKQLGKMRTSPASLKPEEFQDSLASSVASVLATAKKNKTLVPDPNFYLGFGQYKVSPPKAEMVAALAAELEARKWVANSLIEARVDEIAEIGSEEVKQENVQQKPGAGSKTGPPYSKRTFSTTFTCSPASLRTVLNALSSAQEHFFIVTSVNVQNTQEKGPSRTQEVSQVAPGDPNTATTPTLKFIVGEEKIKVLMKIDVLEFQQEG